MLEAFLYVVVFTTKDPARQFPNDTFTRPAVLERVLSHSDCWAAAHAARERWVGKPDAAAPNQIVTDVYATCVPVNVRTLSNLVDSYAIYARSQ